MKHRNIFAGVMSSYIPRIIARSRYGRIHSLFQNSFNIQFESDLVNVNQVDKQLSSFGINLPHDILKNMISTIRLDDIVVIRANRIAIYGLAGDIHVINTQELEMVDLRLQCIVKSKIHLITIINMLNGLICEGCKDLFRPDLEAEKIIKFLPSGEKPMNYFESLSRLVGRGEGLTPSGDDFLFGFFMIHSLFSQESALDDQFLDFVSHNTTDISIAFMKSLKEGFISEYFRSFCDAVTYKDKRGLISSVEKIMTIGHTSGCDALYGIIFGLESLIEEKPESLKHY